MVDCIKLVVLAALTLVALNISVYSISSLVDRHLKVPEQSRPLSTPECPDSGIVRLRAEITRQRTELAIIQQDGKLAWLTNCIKELPPGLDMKVRQIFLKDCSRDFNDIIKKLMPPMQVGDYCFEFTGDDVIVSDGVCPK
jgi:hypothetical protein